jgi:LysM repeat protein
MIHNISSPIVTLYYVPENPNKVVNDLRVQSLPLYRYCTLSWTEPSEPGRYYVYWEVDGEWVYSGNSTTGNSIQVDPSRDIVNIQVRTDDLYPSNVVSISFHSVPATRTLSGISRYDGVTLDWSPNTLSNERVEIRRNNTLVFLDNASSYTHSSGGSFKIRFVKGTGSDLLYGDWSNTVTKSLLSPPPSRVEPEAPCDFYLGVNRAGEQIFHMCNPSVVPDTPPAVETGKDSVDWFQDWVGVNVDYGSDTYFHSKFDYVVCTKAIRLLDYTDKTYAGVGSIREFKFTGAVDIVTGANTTYSINEGRMIMMVSVDANGDRTLCTPALTREIDFTDQAYAIDVLYFGNQTGFGTSSAYYSNNTSFLRSNRGVRSIEIYEFNIRANGLGLEYVDVRGSDDGIKLNPTEFEVFGMDFTNMILSYCNTVTDSSYVDSMNLSDVIIANKGTVDTLGIYHGSEEADAMQILGTSGGSDWDIEMTKGIIKRSGNTWFNAGRGRTRMRYLGVLGTDDSSAFTVEVPSHPLLNENDDIRVSTYFSNGTSSNESIIIDTSGSTVIGYCLVPTAYPEGFDDWTELETAQKPVMGFSSFTSRVHIHTFKKSALFNKSIQASGDPYWEINYQFNVDVYLVKTTDAQFTLEYDIQYRAAYGSGGEPNSLIIPAFSFSFIGLD